MSTFYCNPTRKHYYSRNKCENIWTVECRKQVLRMRDMSRHSVKLDWLWLTRYTNPYRRAINCMRLVWSNISTRTTQTYIHLEPNSTTRTPATNTSYEHHQRTPPTDKNLPYPNILTCRDVGLWHCDVANLFVELLCACPLVVFVAGVRNRCPCRGVWLLVYSTCIAITNSVHALYDHINDHVNTVHIFFLCSSNRNRHLAFINFWCQSY